MAKMVSSSFTTGQSAHRRSVLGRMSDGLRRMAKGPRDYETTDEFPVEHLRILIVTDAWRPQVNGVVRTLETTGRELEQMGHFVGYITPNQFLTTPMPTYPEIRLSLLPNRKLATMINGFKPDAIHIATEGTLGRAARRFCLRRAHPFTTSFHTRFPEYTHARFKVPLEWSYRFLRDFHRPAAAVMVATDSLVEELSERGFDNLTLWSRGVDLDVFGKAEPSEDLSALQRPIWLTVGRVAVEKNVEAFLELDLPGTKVVVGDGPQRSELERRYPDAHFLGARFGEDLASVYAGADVFVFPSKTDTFGLVQVEALAAGTPVAAYPVQGPLDVLKGAPEGAAAMDEDLQAACMRALNQRDKTACQSFAARYGWDACAKQFVRNLSIAGYDEDFWDRSAQMWD
jgi:glycosyltransferase involved in cell wall biosynthesis